MANDTPKSVRLTDDEQNFLDEIGKDFSTFTHDSIQEHKKKKKTLTRAQKINKAVINGFYIIIGMFFFMSLGQTSPNNLIVIGILGGMGILFTIMGAVNLGLSMREDGFFGKRR